MATSNSRYPIETDRSIIDLNVDENIAAAQ